MDDHWSLFLPQEETFERAISIENLFQSSLSSIKKTFLPFIFFPFPSQLTAGLNARKK